MHLDQKKQHEYLKNRFYSSNDNSTTVALNEDIPDSLIRVKQKSDLLEHVQNNLVGRNKVDKVIPLRNIIDERYKENY